MRKTLFKIHSWLALAAMLPLLLISITGAILVFKSEIDGWLMPQKHFAVANTEQRLSLDTLTERIEQRYPEHVIAAWEVFDNDTADRVYTIKKGTEDWYKFHVNQYSGETLSEPVSTTHYITDFLVELHYTFMLNDLDSLPGQTGTVLGFFFALFLLVLGVTGLIIYRKFWRRLFTLRWRATLQIVLSDIHKMTGVFGSPILIILAITGGYFNYAVWYHEVIEHADEEHPVVMNKQHSANLSLQSLMDDSRTQIASFKPTFITLPHEGDDHITFWGEVDSSNPLFSEYGNMVTYNRDTGAHMSNWDIREVAFGWQLIDSFRKLHFGYFAGLVSKIIWAVIGLSPVWLAGTGFYLWYVRSRRKKASKRNRRTQTQHKQAYS
ncbi:PepSY-associated TM helix domain-containing protein [Pseudoalteromonas ruthenica]|uniref:PepSY-associated TM helix domain-containing protein n=1 Tax=Pseudoalteromonas ruthenica TaxID=151081 RepID=UPI00241CA4D5|nr:PepSY-associated TM helix domain-containing protein [Pseudoalteromonas ruthenica]|tara:strand:+ start:15365 stop:16504 length:1140 start_codon:yes stop_codon:yes gene_type:complete